MARVLRSARRLAGGRRVGALLVGLVALLLAAGAVLAPVASAHSSMQTSRPAPGAVLTAAPADVELQFDDALEQAHAVVTVVGPDGRARQLGAPLVRGARVTQAVAGLDVPGRYRVSYRLTSSGDEHPLTGSMTFELAAGAAVRPAGRTGTAAGAVDVGAPPVSRVRMGVLASIAGLLLVAGVLRLRRRPRAPGP